MLWLWILVFLAVLILLLCRTRVGIQAAFGGGSLTLDARVGPLRLRLLPAGAKREKEPKTAKKAEKTPKKAKKQREPLPKPSLADIRDAVHTLAPPLKRALGRTRRGVRVHPLRLSVTVGGREDPAAAAELYGDLHAGVWTGMPVLEQLLVIPAPHIHIGIDFDAADTIAEGELGVSARIGTLLAAALGVGIPALRWFLRYQKAQKQKKTAQPPAHAAA